MVNVKDVVSSLISGLLGGLTAIVTMVGVAYATRKKPAPKAPEPKPVVPPAWRTYTCHCQACDKSWDVLCDPSFAVTVDCCPYCDVEPHIQH